MKLARVMRERAELALRHGENHPAVIEASAAESALREAGFAADPTRFHRNLIRALSSELADARREGRELAGRYGAGHPELLQAETVVASLTSAINAEIRFLG